VRVTDEAMCMCCYGPRSAATSAHGAIPDMTKAAHKTDAQRDIQWKAGSPFLSWPASAVVYVATSATFLSHHLSIFLTHFFLFHYFITSLSGVWYTFRSHTWEYDEYSPATKIINAMQWEGHGNLAYKSVFVYFKTLGEELNNKSVRLELTPMFATFLHTIHYRVNNSVLWAYYYKIAINYTRIRQQ
jgi:hypothetical protein